MKATPKAKKLLGEMAKIDRMERGKVCQMKGREHFNHQTWHEGRNVVRYVPRNEVEELRAATDGYTRFMALAEQYADEIIRITRCQQKSKSQNRHRENNSSAPHRRKNTPHGHN